MHTFNLLIVGIMALSALITIACVFNDDNLTPVGKLFSGLLIGSLVYLVAGQVANERPAPVAYHQVQAVPTSAPPVVVQQFERDQGISDEQFRHSGVGHQVAAAPVVVTAPVQVVAAPVAAPAADSGMKDALLGGALGYALGSAGNRSGGDTHVTHVTNTTVIHQAAPAAVAPRPYVAAAPAPRPVVAAAPAPRPTFTSSAAPRSSYTPSVSSSSSWKSTFSMTRSRR